MKVEAPLRELVAEVGEPISKRSDIPSLDGLRAISIFLVLVAHAVPGTHKPTFFGVGLDFGNLGVRIFFVISGFLITSLLLKERVHSGGVSLRRFYIRRSLRILPAFLLFIGAISLLSVFGILEIPPKSWLYVLTYTVNFAPLPPFPWVLGHLWSLSVEEQFYFLWPMVMKFGRSMTCTLVAIIAVFAGPATHAMQELGGFSLPGIGPFPLVCSAIAMGSLLAMWTPAARSLIVSSNHLSGGRILGTC